MANIILALVILGIIGLLVIADRVCMDHLRREWDEWNG